MSSRTTHILRVLWIGLSLLVLIMTIISFDGTSTSDADLILAYGMLTLSFPVSLLVALLAGAFGYLAFTGFEYVVPVSYPTIVVGWLFFFLTGYWQWFMLVPSIWRRFKRQ